MCKAKLKVYVYLLFIPSCQARLQTFNLQRQQFRIVSTKSQITTHEPESLMATTSPDAPDLSFAIKSPDILDLIGNFIAKNGSCLCSHVLVACGKNDLIGVKYTTIGKSETCRENTRDLHARLYLYGA